MWWGGMGLWNQMQDIIVINIVGLCYSVYLYAQRICKIRSSGMPFPFASDPMDTYMY